MNVNREEEEEEVRQSTGVMLDDGLGEGYGGVTGVVGRNGYHSGVREVLRGTFTDIQNEGDRMPIVKFEFWFHAIEMDDYVLINNILTACCEEEKKILINGRFIYDFTPHHKASLDDQNLPFAFQRPLILATIFRSTRTLQLFLQHGADLFVEDLGSNTVIHGIIWAAAVKPEGIKDYVKIFDFVMRQLPPSKKRVLLYIENSDELRPLELSARMCTFNLFQKIFDTEGVYVQIKGRLGAHVCCWYDVTDYESLAGHRRDRSPLKLFTLLEKEHLKNAKDAQIASHPAMHRWISVTINTNIPYLALWFLVRIFYTLLIFLCATSDYIERVECVWPNTSSIAGGQQGPGYQYLEPLIVMRKDIYDSLRITVLGFSCIIVIFDVLDNVIYHKCLKKREMRYYHCFGSRNFVVRTRFYRICNFFLAASVIVFHLSNMLEQSALSIKAYMLANILNIWSLLFFIQLLPALGYFVTIIQRMLKDMFHFLVLYVILFFSFSQTFYNLFYTNRLCTEEFSDITWSMYSTIRVMLNMIDLMQYPWRDLTDIALLHISYIIVVPILLVNFLIALMSHSVADVAENRYLIMILQRLSCALLVRSRLEKVIPFIYRMQQKSRFVITDGRVFVECLMLKDNR